MYTPPRVASLLMDMSPHALHSALPHSLRMVSICAGAIADWEISDEVAQLETGFDIDVITDAAGSMPIPLADVADWIGCFQAPPHTDESWCGSIFITLTVRGAHHFEYMLAPGKVLSIPVKPGTLFAFDPTRLHWLKPNDQAQEEGFLGLQWEVRREAFPKTYRVIRKGLGAHTVRSQRAGTTVTGWKATVKGEEVL